MRKAIVFSLLIFAANTQADNLSDTNKLLDCAEQRFPGIFSPAGEGTFKLFEYWVRYYVDTDTYAGTTGDDAYVYADSLGGLLYVGKVKELVKAICPAIAGSDLSGRWRINGKVDASNCGEGVRSINYIATVTAKGDQVNFTANGISRIGVINADKIRYTARYQEDGGTTNETGIITVNSETSVSGIQNWNWSNGQSSCTGRTTFSGTKI